ncbi:DnaJ-domain-containing protein [Phanerochaete sordida]|uniref:DnaJ-domain-containing protein n=1 Tax=Phanerochaete sordida TaxID=48140 RepID=A0A9P3GA69_9APHY|nr:DnaJ-domain-containing protein [Phanerochaete sordida]
MASNLYEILELEKTATTEEIRKAYKKKALATHPDRLPPGVSDEEREKANERFRLVNNAYEVLTNTENRKAYDQYGVWPPPSAVDNTPAAGPSYTHEPFSGFAPNPLFGHSRPMHGYAFTDPFELFNSLFGDIHRAFASDPFFGDFPSSRSPFDSIFGPSPLFSRQDDMFGRSPFGSIGFGGGHPLIEMMGGGMGGGNMRSYSSTSQSMGSGGQWVSQSSMTRTTMVSVKQRP